MAKFYCPICNEDMDEVEYTEYGKCLKCFERENTTKISESTYKEHANLKKKLDWNKFNDSLFWST